MRTSHVIDLEIPKQELQTQHQSDNIKLVIMTLLVILTHIIRSLHYSLERLQWHPLKPSDTVAGITKWFWVSIKEYLSYLLPNCEDLVPTTSWDSGAIETRRKSVTVAADYCIWVFVQLIFYPRWPMNSSIWEVQKMWVKFLWTSVPVKLMYRLLK